MTVTIKTIAARAKVSNPTVSRILGGRGGPFAEATRKRVHQLAEELGYRPNGMARSIRSQRFETIGLLLTTDNNRSRLDNNLLMGLHDGLAEHNQHLLIGRLPDVKLTDADFVPRILREWSCDGLIINYTTHVPSRLIELIEEGQIPAIWLNTKDRSVNTILPDDLGAGRAATQRLIELGHRRIAYLDPLHNPDKVFEASDHYSIHDRAAGYRDAMEAARLEPQFILPRSYVARDDRPEVDTAWLNGPDRPTAVVSYSHYGLASVLFGARAGGLRIPHDLSLCVFDDEPVAIDGFFIDTWQIPQRAIGRLAADKIVRQARQDRQASMPEPSTTVPFVHQPGPSVARCRDQTQT